MKKYLNLGLIGYPLGHSISPLIHNESFKAAGIDGNYRLFPVLPMPNGENELLSVIEKMRRGELDGLNVTIPHKTTVIDYLDRLDPVSRAVEAVNTIYLKDDLLIGTNTDVSGFINDLARQPRFAENKSALRNSGDSQHALVLGAGGAARAIVYGLLSKGWKVTIAARRIEQANKIAHSHNNSSKLNTIKTISLNKLELLGFKTRISLVINTTPLGMFPDTDKCPWPNVIPFPQDTFIYDLVYNPLETKMIQKARAEKLGNASGIGMLVEQAAESFFIWTGVQPPRQILLDTAINYLDNSKKEIQK